MRSPRRIIIGSRFGRLVVVARSGELATCRCDCGAITSIRASSLGVATRSCGCFRSERMAKINTKHGQAKRDRVATEWTTWHSMLQRCDNPAHKSYARYGARGITVCERWRGEHGFENFLADMGKRPTGLTLERSNNDGSYSPGNCVWATRSAQAKNRVERDRLDDGTFAPGSTVAA